VLRQAELASSDADLDTHRMEWLLGPDHAFVKALNSAVTKSVLDQSVSGTTTMRSAAISPSTSGIIAMTNAASV